MNHDQAASFHRFDEIGWADESTGAAPAELRAAAQAAGARRKRIVTDEQGFYMNHNVMPAGFTVPRHRHDHAELIVVIEGGCTVLSGGPELVAHDTIAVPANSEYGFVCGPDGMRFLTIRSGEASVAMTEDGGQ